MSICSDLRSRAEPVSLSERALPGQELREPAYPVRRAGIAESQNTCLNTVGQLYGADGPESFTHRICCDVTGCRIVNTAFRDPFWPSFTRPRWLRCRQLYR